MSFVFDEKNASNSLGETSWALGNRTGLKENFSASWDATFHQIDLIVKCTGKKRI